MDNIVDYLIVLFFIISFLTSVFKKKKKQDEKAEKTQQRPIVELKRDNVQKDNVVANKRTSPNRSSFENILKAMLQVPELAEDQKSEVDEYYEQAMLNSSMMKNEKESLIPASVEPRQGKVKVEKSRSYIEEMKEVTKRHSSRKAMKIKDNLYNITTLKEYIVMNEILGKPIALRE